MKKTKKIIVTSLAALTLLSFTVCSDNGENAVVNGYQKVEDFFVNGYQEVEDFFVDCYTAVEDKCVEWFFQKDGETVEQAKDRLNGSINKDEQDNAQDGNE